jgi:hypothetical protein
MRAMLLNVLLIWMSHTMLARATLQAPLATLVLVAPQQSPPRLSRRGLSAHDQRNWKRAMIVWTMMTLGRRGFGQT